jgi:hypothetical protein
VALLVATLVATGGVSFAVGRWSTGEAGSGSPAIAAGPAIDFAAAGAGGFPDSLLDAAPAGLGTAIEAAAESDTETSTDEAAAQPDSGWSDTGQPAAPETVSEPDAAAQLDLPDAAAEVLPGLVGQAPSAGDGPGAGDGPPAGGFGDLGGFPGFGRGIEGSISAIEDGQLTIESADGMSSTVLVDASTEVLRREVGGIDALEVGDAVRIVPGFGAGPRGAVALTGDAATSGDAGELAASQVVVLDSGGA